MLRAHAIDSLQLLQPDLAKECGIQIIGLVGSVAREQAKPESDLDIVYDRLLTRRVTLMDISRASRLIALKIGQEIDLIGWAAVKPHYRQFMSKDLVRLDG